MRIVPLGDRALAIELGDTIDERVRRRVAAIAGRLRMNAIPGVTDVVPGYASVVVHCDPAQVAPALSSTSRARALPLAVLAEAVERLVLAVVDDRDTAEPRVIEIPVCYDESVAPDLAPLAALHHIEPAEIVRRHAGGSYVVHMLGFLPGFPYLGGLDPLLATPRRETPRLRVPAGSVGIGGSQTGVYPLESPGGWHLIGRTPLRLFDVTRAEPALLRLGDRVRFAPIDLTRYRALAPDPR